MPLVSVVVPSYNHETYIGEALASVYRQTHQHLELILIDDNSTDGTFSLAKKMVRTPEYTARFKRIVCNRNSSNIGAHNTINVGISLARGSWISLLNSDDAYHPNRVVRLLGHAASSNAKFLFSGLDFLYGPDILLSDRVVIKKITEAQGNAHRYPSLREALFHFNFCATTGNMFFKKEVAQRLGGLADLKYCHDWDFVMRAAEVFKLSFLKDKLYSYRLHGTNSFKSLEAVGRKESEIVARGVRERSSSTFEGTIAWQFGSMGLLSNWLGYR